jgi:rare lipoprotein A
MRSTICLLTLLAVAGADFAAAEGSRRGQASYYGHAGPTASGESFQPASMTAAHRTLPFGTRVRVTDVKNGRSVVVRINDRGPFVRGRIIDVSRGAASALGMIGRGVATVEIQVLH